MSKETILRCQDPKKLMNVIGAKTATLKNVGMIGSLYGMKVFKDDSIPTDEVHLVDGEGKILQKFRLK